LIRASLNATVGIELGRWWVEQGFVVIEARQVDMPRGDHEEGAVAVTMMAALRAAERPGR
jgi:hypothetical protein